MRVSDFDFDVPAERIATSPADPPSSAKLLVYQRSQQTLTHRHFSDLPAMLEPGSLLVFNESRVLRSRFRARRLRPAGLGGANLGGADLEGLVLPCREGPLRAWIKGKVSVGETIDVAGFGGLTVKARDSRTVVFEEEASAFIRFLRRSGEIPLPPYIVNERERRGFKGSASQDERAYQSLLASPDSAFDRLTYSSAAPTASLHFDADVLAALSARSLEILHVGLDIGAATFSPLDEGSLETLEIAAEWCEVQEETWQKIERARAEGRKIVAVGTTVLRALESVARRSGPYERIFETTLTVKPPFTFQVVDHLITNFHWGRSSLLVLAATFMEAASATEGASPTLKGAWRCVYEEALLRDYLFYSFGDGMLLL